MEFSELELKRYDRQMRIDGWGVEGQKRLRAATVFIAGAGGLGSPVALSLAAAGVGTLRIVDCDSVDWSNLNRQVLHDPSRVGLRKVISARQTIERLNPLVRVEPIDAFIDESSVDALVGPSDIIVDCMDNFPTRFALNECALRKGIPLVYGSVWGMDGRLSFLHPPETPCLRCIFPEAPPKEVFPVVGATPAVIGSLQALETLKYLTRTGHNLKGKLLSWDGDLMQFDAYTVKPDPDCPACAAVRARARTARPG
jgi:adenylyltransferase/sulfurtransferase